MAQSKNINISGNIWKFDDNIDTDVIIATQYLVDDISEMKMHTFESIDPDFAKKIKPGDIILGGNNFGCGSSRQQAVDVLKELGIAAIIAKSFARIFFRNSINLGLPVIEIKDIDNFDTKNDINIIIKENSIEIINGPNEFTAIPFPEFILNILLTNRKVN
jgi:3-isopropylmalate/(R)-2-methylmalate dehydratase small subunit